MIWMMRYYGAQMKMAAQRELQYRTAAYFLLVGFLVEPVVYLVVWRTIAESQGGAIGGYTADAFTAYFIVWTLVRAMNLALTPYVWDWWIQRGRLSDFLLQPIHPIHRNIAWFAGSKLVWIVMWIPIAVILSLTFKPSFEFDLFQIAAFLVVMWTGYVIRFMTLWVLGLISFWTTRASAIFEIVIAGELLLSGRLVPLSVMPPWVQDLANWLPFKWTFQYPIETVIGRLSTGEIVTGFLIQMAWIVGLWVGARAIWNVAIKRYTAVGT